MAFFNGDRVCAKKERNDSCNFLEFGRVQEYVDIEEAPSPATGQFSHYGDVLSTDESLLSSCCGSPPPLDSDGGKLLKRVPLLNLSPSSKSRSSPSLPAILDEENAGEGTGDNGNNEGPLIPGLTSPIMMKRSKSQPDMIGRIPGREKEDKLLMEKIKKRIIWDHFEKPETEISGGEKDEQLYRVIDRKFSVGQYVTPSTALRGFRKLGKIVDIAPVATVRVPFSEPENKHENGHVILDLNISQIKPISPIFSGVTIEYCGWLGLVTDVERRVVYKLEDSTYLSRRFSDTVLIRNSRVPPTPSSASSASAKEQRRIQNQFPYPFMENSEMPFTGKVVRFSQLQLQQLKIEEEEDKENNQKNRYATRSKTGSGGSSSTSSSSLSMETRRRSKSNRENFITAIVESVSIVSIKVRWTGRLPAYLIKLKSAAAEAEKEKAKRGVGVTQQANHYYEQMPATFIRSAEDVKKVRPLYINPAMYFEKKGLCAYTTEKKDEEIMIPERLWSYELYSGGGGGGGDSNNRPEVVAPFNLSTVSLSPWTERKDSSPRNTDDYDGKGKRKRCHDEDSNSGNEESSTGVTRTVIVCKHFVRHVYKVVWDNNESSGLSKRRSAGDLIEWRSGTDLHPVTQEHKLCLGLIHSHLYVLPRSSCCVYGHCDYGVVVDKPTDTSVAVEWIKIQKDGSVKTVRVLRCDLIDIEKHPRFNELHEGRVVVRAQSADKFRGAAGEFYFGTILKVNRFALGQISVYCPVQEKSIELWPHMVELFVGMTMQELIAHKVVGANRKLDARQSE